MSRAASGTLLHRRNIPGVERAVPGNIPDSRRASATSIALESAASTWKNATCNTALLDWSQPDTG
jgi:hypothetical protein